MIKLVVTDLDGTLLNEQRKVSKKSKEAIEILKASGINIAIATGRPYFGTIDIIEQSSLIDDNGFSIFNTGASIQKNSDGTILYELYLTNDDIYYIQSKVRDYSVNVAAYAYDKIYCDEDVFYNGIIHDSKILNMPIYTNLMSDKRYGRINIMGSAKELDSIMLDKSAELKVDYKIVRNELFSIELLRKEAGKGNALRKLSEFLNLDLYNEVMVIGDGYNDIDMLSLVKNSVAMNNAPDEVKSVCNYSTLSNVEEGFYNAIKRFI